MSPSKNVFRSLHLGLKTLPVRHWIVCGDFNSILDVNKDVQILDQRRCAKAQSLGDFVSYNELSDIYRVLNPTSRRMTFFHKTVNTGC